MHPKPGIKVREATTKDAADIQMLARELAETVGDAPPVEEAVRKRLEELLETPSSRVLVVENGRGVVGAVASGSNPTSPTATPSSKFRCSSSPKTTGGTGWAGS